MADATAETVAPPSNSQRNVLRMGRLIFDRTINAPTGKWVKSASIPQGPPTFDRLHLRAPQTSQTGCTSIVGRSQRTAGAVPDLTLRGDIKLNPQFRLHRGC